MTVHRRPLLLIAGAALVLPACISISARPTPLTPPEVAAKISVEGAARAVEPPRRNASQFAIYPSRPGETVPTKAVAKDAATAQKLPSRPAPPDELVGPVPPPNPFTTTSAEAPVARDPSFLQLTPRSAIGIESPLLAAFRAHMDGKPERAFGAIAELDRANQELILAILPVLSRGAAANLTADPMTTAALVEQLHGAAARLEPLAALRIEAALFCDNVTGFGQYTPWGVNKPYRPNEQAQLYLEVRNLVSQPAADAKGERYLTQARCRAEVRDAYGKLVPLPDPNDYHRRVNVLEFERKLQTRAPVQDFHILCRFPAPTTPGVYAVAVTVSDAAGRRSVTSQPIEFRVAGP
jgi:hypothetical protein